MPSSSSDSHPPPYDNVDGPFISKQEKSAGSAISFDSRKQFWSNMASLSWRCMTTALSLSLLIIGLRIFSRMGKLSQIEQRGFNAITILLGAFASLGLGSLLGYLGSMLRWSLLARRKYKMRDIELLFAMVSPTGSAKLLVAHVQEWRLSTTTFIVMLYLLVNITGRFSVAIFGLTYNLVDDSVEDAPTLTTDWNSTILLAKNVTDFEMIEKSPLSYLDLVRGGLTTINYRPGVEPDFLEPRILEPWDYYSLIEPIWGLEGTGGNVDLAYHITKRVGVERFLETSDHVIHSSAKCTIFRLDGYKYWRDYGSDNQTSKDWKDEKNREEIAEVLRVLDSNNAWFRHGEKQVTWAAPLAGGTNGSSVTYVVHRETAWECVSRLFETVGGNPHPEPLFNSPTLFLLPIMERVELGGALGPTGHMGNSCGGPLVGGTSAVVYRSFADLKRQSSPSVGVQALNFYQNGTGGSAAQKEHYNLYIATLIARLPITAIAYGNRIFPGMYKDDNPTWAQRVETTLEVKWDRVVIAAGTIAASQILVIIAVVYYCRNVYIREDSCLTTGELLKTVLNTIDDGNTMSAKELGDALDKALGGPVSYGTIPGSQGDQPKVALGCEVEYKFPGFPSFQKSSIFRW